MKPIQPTPSLTKPHSKSAAPYHLTIPIIQPSHPSLQTSKNKNKEREKSAQEERHTCALLSSCSKQCQRPLSSSPFLLSHGLVHHPLRRQHAARGAIGPKVFIFVTVISCCTYSVVRHSHCPSLHSFLTAQERKGLQVIFLLSPLTQKPRGRHTSHMSSSG